jgi:uncharacterized protein
MKRHFLIKLIPPRPSFALDMTNEEKRLMQEHVVYWTGLADKGVALLFGPVLDPAGSYGIGVVEVQNEEELKVLTANDPVTKSGREFRHEAYVMQQVVVAAVANRVRSFAVLLPRGQPAADGGGEV